MQQVNLKYYVHFILFFIKEIIRNALFRIQPESFSNKYLKIISGAQNFFKVFLSCWLYLPLFLLYINFIWESYASTFIEL